MPALALGLAAVLLGGFGATAAYHPPVAYGLGIQAIVIDDRYFEAARRSVDFIKRYIFPGGRSPLFWGSLATGLGLATALTVVLAGPTLPCSSSPASGRSSPSRR